MKLVRPGLLASCVLVLGSVAFVPSIAQAEKGASWRVNGTAVNSTLKPGVSAVLENETGSLLTTILGVPTKILCKTIEVTNTMGIEGVVNEGIGHFANCATYLNNSPTPSAPCLPKSLGINDLIETNPLVGLLVLIGGVGEVLMKAAKVTADIATIESTEECAVGQKVLIKGELYLKDCEGKIKEERGLHLFEADNVAGTLTAGGNAVTLDGSANVSLGGTHKGLWSGLPA